MKNNSFKFYVFLLIGIFVISFSSALSSGTTNNWQANQPTFDGLYSGTSSNYWPILSSFEEAQCKSTTSDFIVSIPVGGCSPNVVRSDLLAEQNVPVFCQISAIKVNPLIDVSYVKSISFKGDYPDGVSGISFHPARAAIKSTTKLLGDPIVENIGYIVIILKKEKIDSKMPEWIAGNLTAVIGYDAQKAYGISNGQYYLMPGENSEMIWNGKGYIKVDDIGEGAAKVLITSKDEKIYGTAVLKEGETSNTIYLPGYYCSAGVKIKLNKIVAPEDKALLNINGDTIWARVGDRILDGKCVVKSLNVVGGGTGQISISCPGKNIFLELKKNKAKINDKFYSLGDEIDVSGTKYYLGYYDSVKISGEEKEYAIVFNTKIDAKAIAKLNNILKDVKEVTALGDLSNKIDADRAFGKIDTNYWILEKTVSNKGLTFSGTENALVNNAFTNEFKQSVEITKALLDSYPVEKKATGEYWGEDVLFNEIVLAGETRNFKTQNELIDLFTRQYPNSGFIDHVRTLKMNLNYYDVSGASYNLQLNNEFYNMFVMGFQYVDAEDKQVVLRIGTKSVTAKEKETGVSDLKLTINSIGLNSVNIGYLDIRNRPQNIEIENGKSKQINEQDVFVSDIMINSAAFVSVIPDIRNNNAESSFTFKIGIEQRDFKLNPNKTSEKIKELNKTIENWNNRLDTLGKLIKGWKGACLATSTVLSIKSMVSGFSGESLARQKVMEKYGEECSSLVMKGTYATKDACYSAKAKEINSDVAKMTNAINNVNSKLKKAQEGNTKSNGLFQSDSIVDQDMYVEEIKKNIKDGWEYTLSSKKIVKSDLTTSVQVRSVMLYEELKVLDSNCAGVACLSAKKEMEKELNVLAMTSSANTAEPSKGCSNVYTSPQIRYYETGNNKGLPAIVPFDKDNGWYAYVPNSAGTLVDNGLKTYSASGDVSYFWICNVGKNGIMENKEGDDICQSFSVNSVSNVDRFFGCDNIKLQKVGNAKVSDLYNMAREAIRQASNSKASSLKVVNILGTNYNVGNPVSDNGDFECTDFMSPEDCLLMFNVCDPVICPSSRCDLGGKYPVTDVIQTGIVGSIALCLPNWPEVKVPVCLSGVYAGLDSYVSILRSYQACLEENLKTGEYVGICDQITSIYMCEFFWKQISPMINIFGPKIIESVAYGGKQSTNGGGEYLTVQTAWQNLDKSMTYFTDYYAENAFRAFSLKNVEEAGTEVCNGFIGTSFPTSAKALDSFTEPESPTQFYASFSESVYSDVTVPSTSQYKVFYHIYAGRDIGVQYKVYLKNPPMSSYYQNNPTIEVKSGYIAKASEDTQAIDFTAPSGYKELCVVINGEKPECGFNQVTSDFGIQMASNLYVEEQVSKNNIITESECVSTSASSSYLTSLNLQESAETAIGGEDVAMIGITRICSSENPNSRTGGYSKWVDVGYCDNQKIRCWLNTENINEDLEGFSSVQGTTILEMVQGASQMNTVNSGYTETGNNLISLRQNIEGLNIGSLEDENVKKILSSLNGLIDGQGTNNQKAEAYALKYSIYKKVVENNTKAEAEKSSGGAVPAVTQKEEKSVEISEEVDDGEDQTANLNNAEITLEGEYNLIKIGDKESGYFLGERITTDGDNKEYKSYTINKVEGTTIVGNVFANNYVNINYEHKNDDFVGSKLIELEKYKINLKGKKFELINIKDYETNKKTNAFKYWEDGAEKSINFDVYKGLSDVLTNKEINLVYSSELLTMNFESLYLDNFIQETFLKDFINKIKIAYPDDVEKQARVAISLIQRIPYDSACGKNLRYPYQVLFDNKGDCDEKSRLMIFVLRELGFSTAMIYYNEGDKTKHANVGIKCDEKYDNENTGYCFIETTIPSIITDDRSGTLKRTKILEINKNGKTFDAKEEYEDVLSFNNIRKEIRESGKAILLQVKELKRIKKKYGIDYTLQDSEGKQLVEIPEIITSSC